MISTASMAARPWVVRNVSWDTVPVAVGSGSAAEHPVRARARVAAAIAARFTSISLDRGKAVRRHRLKVDAIPFLARVPDGPEIKNPAHSLITGRKGGDSGGLGHHRNTTPQPWAMSFYPPRVCGAGSEIPGGAC